MAYGHNAMLRFLAAIFPNYYLNELSGTGEHIIIHYGERIKNL